MCTIHDSSRLVILTVDAAGADDAAAAAARRGPAEGDQAHPHLHRHRRRYNLTSSIYLLPSSVSNQARKIIYWSSGSLIRIYILELRILTMWFHNAQISRFEKY